MNRVLHSVLFAVIVVKCSTQEAGKSDFRPTVFRASQLLRVNDPSVRAVYFVYLRSDPYRRLRKANEELTELEEELAELRDAVQSPKQEATRVFRLSSGSSRPRKRQASPQRTIACRLIRSVMQGEIS